MMRLLKWWFFCLMIILVAGQELFPQLDHVRPSASLSVQTGAVNDLIKRVIGDQSSLFHVVIDEKLGPAYRDTFNIVSDGSSVLISANSGIAASMGFYFYLKRKCGCQFTWAGSQLNLPHPLPVIAKPGVTVTSNDRFRYYQNVCTVSYSSVWWDWPRWERHIDWMAMNGINLPLAFTGQEAIFKRVYMKLGFTFEDLQAHFGGPAFLAWSRMGNMRGWGGPIPESWIDNQLALQHKILSRMRSLGMVPVLPGFAGHVPAAITRVFPDANVSRLGDWGHFDGQYCCTYLLDFQDKLFNKIGSSFIQEMKEEFGVDHVYNSDSFNEMTPKSSDVSYLRNAGKAVYNAMITSDPDAIWLMQGWLFQEPFWKPPQIEALLTSVPKGRMIVLDLFAEVFPIYQETKSFYGQPFIWCMLHNFGGTLELYGAIESINKGPFIGRTFPNSTMVGTGLAPEGIFQNEVIYEFMNENAYAKAPRNLTEWFSDFATGRYGHFNQHAINAWQILKRSVYNNTDNLRDHSKQVIPTSRPRLHALDPDVWYDPKDLYTAWKEMIQASQTLSSTLFRYDLVDIGRNSLQVLAIKFYTEVLISYHHKKISRLERAGSELMTLLVDLDLLLGSDSHFLLGTWLRDARRNGGSKAEEALMEFNARNQITLWGPFGNIRDYGCKQWSGLIIKYYAQRWNLFLDMVHESLSKGVAFNQTDYDIKTFELIEQPFSNSTYTFPVEPKGDSIQISRDMFAKYQPSMESTFYGQLKGKFIRLEKSKQISVMGQKTSTHAKFGL